MFEPTTTKCSDPNAGEMKTASGDAAANKASEMHPRIWGEHNIRAEQVKANKNLIYSLSERTRATPTAACRPQVTGKRVFRTGGAFVTLGSPLI